MPTIVIESDQAYARTQELAARAGKSVAVVVVDAVEAKLDRTPSPTTRVPQDRREPDDLDGRPPGA